MNKRTQAYIIIVVAIILLILSIQDLDFNNLREGPFSGIVGSIAFILLGILNIHNLKKKEEDKASS